MLSRGTAKRLLVACLVLMPAVAVATSIRVVDDFGREVVLQQPAQRILSLAPHITENLFSAGAGDRIVGVVEHSDYPPAAQRIPSVGSYVQFNLEAVLDLDPDLVVAWQGGSNSDALKRLEQLGMTIYYSEPRSFDEILENITELAQLAGSEARMDPQVSTIAASIDAVRQQYQHKRKLDVFYQIWSEPLMTLNGEHFVSRALELCGANNLFAELAIIAPRVNIEAVIDANPDIIITGKVGGVPLDLSMWDKWTAVKAVNNDAFILVESDVMHRHTLRMLQAIPGFCAQIDEVRNNEQ